MRSVHSERGDCMTAGEVIAVIKPSDRLQVIEDGKVIYCGWVALLPHHEKEKHIKAATVKRFAAHLDIKHKNWKERGLMAPLEPEETPDYRFSDLQTSLYNTIYI